MQQEEERGRTGRKPWVKNGEGAEARQGWMEAAVWRRKKKEPFGCCSSLDSPFPPPCVLSLSIHPSVLRPPPPHAVKEEEGYHVRKTLSRPPPFLAPFLPSSLYFPFLPCSLPAAADAAASVALSTTNQGNGEGGGGGGRLRRETFFRSLSALLPSWPSPFSPLPLGRPPSFPLFRGWG